jgi:hypothetical protein
MIGRIGGKGDEGRRSVWRAGIAGFLSPVVLLLPLIGGALWLRWLYVVRSACTSTSSAACGQCAACSISASRCCPAA